MDTVGRNAGRRRPVGGPHGTCDASPTRSWPRSVMILCGPARGRRDSSCARFLEKVLTPGMALTVGGHAVVESY